MGDILLSLCMIVKNEAEFISKCLSSVEHVVDEMIIVDTGSEDNTVEIANTHGAKIYRHKWTGNFAEARNVSLRKAKGKWILWMDADEILDARDAQVLRDGVQNSEKDILFVHLLNYSGEKEPSDYEMYTINHHRLFRNDKGLTFVHPIHEQLHSKEGSHVDLQIGLLPVRIHHFGYMEEVVRKRKKFERNMNMLNLQEGTEVNDPWIHYHIASEYYRMGHFNKAFSYLNKAIIHFLSAKQLPPSMLYHMKYSILIVTGSVNNAEQGIDKALQIYPDYVDLHFFKGVILYKLSRYAEALNSFRHCIEMGENITSHLSRKGRGSFYAFFYIGLTYEAIGVYKRAEEAYQHAIEQFPGFKEAQDRLETIRTSHEKDVN